MGLRRAVPARAAEAGHHGGAVTEARRRSAAAGPGRQALDLQRRVGNQAVLHLVRAGLEASRPGDALEREADRAAARVAAGLAHAGLPQSCTDCTAAAPCAACGPAAPARDGALADLGPGEPLPPATRAFMQSRFAHDFGQVRVYAGPKAAEAAGAASARAFTLGRNVVFGAGQYAPGTRGGRWLLAHELAHVVQQHRAGGAGLRRAPACKNQDAVDELMRENSRGYPSTVTMYAHVVKSGENLWKLAKVTAADNKVADVGDLSKELTTLNASLGTLRAGNCVVLIKGWVSPTFVEKTKKVSCDERIEKFKKDAAYKHYTAWERETVRKGDAAYKPVVERVSRRTPGLYEGRAAEYERLVETLNEPWIGPLNEGDCVALPMGWKDPNIGRLPPKPTGKIPTGDVAKAIAAVYSEQTSASPNGQEQQKYIWFSIRKRIETAVRGPDLESVLSLKAPAKSEYHAVGGSDYNEALEDLKNETPTNKAVLNAKTVVLENWSAAPPKDAGAFYFHWRRDVTPTVEACYGKPKPKEREAKEKACAWAWANKQGWTAGVSKEDGWLKRLRGDTAAPDERIGSMYIYP